MVKQPADIGDLECLLEGDCVRWFMFRREDGVVTYYLKPWGSCFDFHSKGLYTNTLALPKEYAL